MIRFFRGYGKKIDDFNHTLLTIMSCTNLNQAIVAHRMSDNYGKMYGHDRSWSQLDTKISALVFEYIDQLKFEERKSYGN